MVVSPGDGEKGTSWRDIKGVKLKDIVMSCIW